MTNKTNKFGLGRGLADLRAEMGVVPDIAVLAGGERIVVRNINLADIITNPDQPRKTFNEQELQELANSIREQGVLQPILVRNSSKTPGKFEIIAGERRFRASKMVGLDTVPALVKSINDNNAMEIALIENVQRENLNAVEEGAAYKNLMEALGYTIADIEKLIGKSASYVRNIMRLDGLPTSVKDMIMSGELSASHARTIAVAKDPTKLAREIIAKNLSVEDTAQRVKDTKKSLLKPANSHPEIDTKKMEKRIEKATGAPTKIKLRRGGAGDIILSFGNKFQMEQLIDNLTT